ncbi:MULTISPECIES: glycoside hydrolase family 25 protein [Faecalicoccus]|uniref:Glycoside hydrolase family 25 protein n=1 Tax=Faecalicoccus pleomorphus TaxID=1323 RepID=A0AAW6CUE2_9FIRM|nr:MULTISPECIES: glycoside hydrolase family 25 protein [Faecalicoccus]MDB7980719.1 glycoside hydrolase family 25 protein [Faecalicoccus pleomorphus]MDB7982926.1 glycoside hydrolase family 25 protein [Faecalicoccus pleomorphus]
MKRKRKAKKLRILILMMVLLGVLTFVVHSLFSQAETMPSSYYDLDRFENASTGFKFYNDPDYESKIGIDVSEHNGTIDWTAVTGTGIDFAFIRAGYRGGIEGKIHEDATFAYNMEQAQDKGLKLGVYWYSSAINTTELQEEIDFVLSLVSSYSIDLPIVFDMEFFDEQEGRINTLSVEEKTDLALMFCDAMEEHGYESMIYGNLDWFYNQLDFSRIQDRNLWYAAYQDKPAMQDRFMIWQYSHTGTLPGISTNVDMNIMPVKNK